ncbi:hypothetical protein EYR40_002846 [Pleurotus pulmonarius]|nr:hypothetical protein EYR40_002846 [Pleurotus pulmonarius]
MSFRISKFLLCFVVLTVLAPIRAPIRVYGAPTPALLMRHEGHDDSTTSTTDFKKQNGIDAQKLNAQFAGLKKGDACNDGEQACVETSFAQCVGGKWTLTPCASGTVCVALPLVNKPGTSIACDSESDATARILAAGAEGGLTGNGTVTGSGSAGTVGDDDELECDGNDDDDDTTSADDDLECDDADDDDETGAPASSSASVPAASTSSIVTDSASATALQKNVKPAATTIFLNSPSPSPILSKRQFGLTSVAIIPVPETTSTTTSSSAGALETPAVSVLSQASPSSSASITSIPTSVSAASTSTTSPAVISTPEPVTIISSVSAAPAPISTTPAGGVTTVTAVIFSTVTVTVGASSISTSSPAVTSAVSSSAAVVTPAVTSTTSPVATSSSSNLSSVSVISSSTARATSSAAPAVFFSFASPAPAATSSLSDPGNVNLAPTPAPNPSSADAAEIARLLTATL